MIDEEMLKMPSIPSVASSSFAGIFDSFNSLCPSLSLISFLFSLLNFPFPISLFSYLSLFPQSVLPPSHRTESRRRTMSLRNWAPTWPFECPISSYLFLFSPLHLSLSLSLSRSRSCVGERNLLFTFHLANKYSKIPMRRIGRLSSLSLHHFSFSSSSISLSFFFKYLPLPLPSPLPLPLLSLTLPLPPPPRPRLSPLFSPRWRQS